MLKAIYFIGRRMENKNICSLQTQLTKKIVFYLIVIELIGTIYFCSNLLIAWIDRSTDLLV